jgi:L-cysteine:1D-myo-inositol 2-amino-2-deoxy-alpha-D-glucopyranoside ligase
MGHAATYNAWDLLVRAWRDAGHEVSYTQNVTDVDDPLLERADRDGDDWRELALREIARYRGDMEALRVLLPTHLIGAVEALAVIDEFAAKLAARGALYELDGDVYFARAADPEFGALAGPGTASGLSLGEMADLARQRGGDPDRSGKKDPLDPLVWRAERPGEPAWDSRFGRGRPGWHVECAAIAAQCLGRSFDVQAGGSDLVFPHHEMSASHSRVALGWLPGDHVFARVYAHSGMVAYQGAKMSKSLGNLVFVSRLREAGVDPMAIRLALHAHHYRSDWEWTDGVLAEAVARLSKWRAAVATAGATASDVPPAALASSAPLIPLASAVLQAVRERMADDLDAPGALAAIDEWADAVLANRMIFEADAALVRDTADALLGIAL